MPSPSTVSAYLAALPAERRAVVSAVRDVVRRHMPAGYEEAIAFGMIGWGIPLARYPDTYNGQPLSYVALAAQKHHYALYLNCAYQDPEEASWLRREFAQAGRKLDMGKSCLRFKSLDDLPLDTIGRFVARTSPDAFIAQYERARAGASRPSSKAARKPAAKKKAVSKTLSKTLSKAVSKTSKSAASRRASKRAPARAAAGKQRPRRARGS